MLFELVNPRLNQESELSEFIGTSYVLALPTLETEREYTQARKRRIVEVVVGSILAAMIPAVTILSHFRQ
jgi:hypothetical protein